MKKKRYSQTFKLKVVLHYLSHPDCGYSRTASLFGLHRNLVNKWIDIYRVHGEHGLKKSLNRSYSFEFKKHVVLTIQHEGLSLSEAMKRFKLKDTGMISRWLALYRKGGIELLKPRKRSRKACTRNAATQYKPESTKSAKSPPELLDELAYLRAENAYLKKLTALNSEGKKHISAKTKIITELRQFFPLKTLLKVAEISRSTSYYHQKKTQQKDKYADVKIHIYDIYHQHKGRYGYRRITLALRKQQIHLNHKCVQRLMQTMGLKSRIRAKKYYSYKRETGSVADNLLHRQFEAEQPNMKWVTDVTEFNHRGEKLYLSPMMDLFNREIVAFRTSRKPVFDLVKNMLSDAMEKLKSHEKPLIHSDPGWQYQMIHYQNQITENGLIQSMSRKGNCLDNAAMESFFGILKSECYHGVEFSSIDELEKTITDYIYYYNHDGIKIKLNGLSPVEHRTQSIMGI
nr:IS3 family transposase [Xenorhabdus bovienii]